MFRAIAPAVLLTLLASGCGAGGADIEYESSGRESGESVVEARERESLAPRECLVAHVDSSVIQLHRVVVTLDAGAGNGVSVGMGGVLATGRQITIISVDIATSRAIVTGLNLRIAPGTEACLFVDGN